MAHDKIAIMELSAIKEISLQRHYCRIDRCLTYQAYKETVMAGQWRAVLEACLVSQRDPGRGPLARP